MEIYSKKFENVCLGSVGQNRYIDVEKTDEKITKYLDKNIEIFIEQGVTEEDAKIQAWEYFLGSFRKNEYKFLSIFEK